MTVQELYDHITKFMTPEEALKKLLSSAMVNYESLKFDDQQNAVHPLIVITMATLDMGWQIAVETPKHPETAKVEGLVIGTQEYLDKIFKDEAKNDSVVPQ